MASMDNKFGENALLADVGEYALHHWLTQTLATTDQNVIHGVGDDCAVLDVGLPNSYLLVTSDRVPLLTDGTETGRFAVVHNVSDILAMRGTPIGFLLNIYLPRDTPINRFEEIVLGAKNACREFNIAIVGGDTKEDSKATVVGTCLGLVKHSDLTLRSTAKPGDVVALTRTRGKRFGLRWAYWVAKYFDVSPDRHAKLHKAYLDQLKIPYEIMINLQGVKGITSCIDMTEGLLGASAIIASASKVSLILEELLLRDLIDEEACAVARELGKAPMSMLFSPGFDWENLLTLDPSLAGEVLMKFEGQILPVGRVDSGSKVYLESGDIRREVQIFSDQKFQNYAWENAPQAWVKHRWFD